MKNLLVLVILVLATPGAYAVPTKVDPLKPLRETLLRIKDSEMTEFHFEKIVDSKVMDTKTTYDGHAAFAGSKFRFETTTPQKELVVYDGVTLWIVQEPDPAFGGPTQVMRGKISGKQKNQAVLSDLLARGRLMTSFVLHKAGETAEGIQFDGVPKKKDLAITSVTLIVKDKELKRLEYVDDVANKTTLRILAQKLVSTARPNFFKYKPPKGAQVTNL